MIRMNEKSTWISKRSNGYIVHGTGIPYNQEPGTILTTEDGDKLLWDGDLWKIINADKNEADPVNHPSHYTRFNGIEVIQLTEQLNFCRGNAVKYIARAGAKDPASEIQDLEKAIWYIQREIDRLCDDAIDEEDGYYDYYASFDEVVWPDKCQECDGSCTVC